MDEDDVRRTMKDGHENYWRNRIRWARQDLARAGVLDGSERGLWRLTAHGQRLAALGATDADLRPEKVARRVRDRNGRSSDGADFPNDPTLPPSGSASLRESPPTPTADSLSFGDAVEYVLDRSAGRRPMHYQEITDRILNLGLVNTSGQMPANTVYAQISSEVSRQKNRGETPRFIRFGKGIVGLSKWTDRSLVTQIEQHNVRTRKQLHERLFTITPAEFEGIVAQLLVALGFEDVTVTGRSGDGGIDVRGTLVVGDVIRTRMAVQVKRWKRNVQAPIVQQVRGSLGTHDQGLIISASNFSRGARDESQQPNKTPVALMNGEQLVYLLMEHEIGVQREAHTLFHLAEENLTDHGAALELRQAD